MVACSIRSNPHLKFIMNCRYEMSIWGKAHNLNPKLKLAWNEDNCNNRKKLLKSLSTRKNLYNIHEIEKLKYESYLFNFNQERETVFHYCAQEGNVDVLKAILAGLHSGQIQLAVNKQSKNGWSPLIVAASKGHVEAVKVSIDLGSQQV